MEDACVYTCTNIKLTHMKLGTTMHFTTLPWHIGGGTGGGSGDMCPHNILFGGAMPPQNWVANSNNTAKCQYTAGCLQFNNT